MNYEVLSENIKKFRKKANLTQKELGKKIYKSEILIRKYESGKVNIPPSTLLDICNVLNVDIETMLGSNYITYCMKNFSERLEKTSEVAEHALSVLEEYKLCSESWRDACIEIENNPKHLLNAILNYLENTEEYYSSFFVNTRNTENNENEVDDSLPYLTTEQINNIVNKVTDLVKYEIYKIENRKSE